MNFRRFAAPLLALGIGLVPPAYAQDSGTLSNEVLNELLRGSSDGAAPIERKIPFGRAEMELSFAPLVKETAPAVVNVYASAKVAVQSPFAGDPFFEQFFGGPQMPPRVQSSL